MPSPAVPSPAPDLDHLALLRTLQGAFAASIGAVAPDSRVPWCGRWRVRDVVVHLARIHHWAAAEARGSREVPLGRGPFDLEPFYRACAAELTETLARLGPDAVCSTLVGRGPASFWRRRQVHETLVHLWDVRTVGGLAVDVNPAVWADTVDEVVTVMQPRQVRLGRMPPLAHTLALVADDVVAPDGAVRRWHLGGDDTDPTRDPTHDRTAGPCDGAAVEVRGPARAVALLLWGRTAPDDAALRVTGDRAVLDDVLAQRLTP
ncbi:maleylpyruvate isomerase family mycothiol-dependent enzyme [Cellulomonas sp. ATA003]|uniref:maleylpyruvate isomerase family mycothiol-dependent enzyme n=1 Tax=Cellulomonas sp. ATA003 TaxID=3073064 RepID=UPI0028734312|nr:maleylpyruvate isomerase family mycothiol-dependent enzyme [Cellulomonas sp. ATA003]WNB86104.1 maleylpyruvate isomerase family mycothiol-dependent enzyme [Cellulomonas sp. ATA003]